MIPYVYKKLIDKIKYKPKINYHEFVQECLNLRLSKKEIREIIKELEQLQIVEANKRVVRLKKL